MNKNKRNENVIHKNEYEKEIFIHKVNYDRYSVCTAVTIVPNEGA